MTDPRKRDMTDLERDFVDRIITGLGLEYIPKPSQGYEPVYVINPQTDPDVMFAENGSNADSSLMKRLGIDESCSLAPVAMRKFVCVTDEGVVFGYTFASDGFEKLIVRIAAADMKAADALMGGSEYRTVLGARTIPELVLFDLINACIEHLGEYTDMPHSTEVYELVHVGGGVRALSKGGSA